METDIYTHRLTRADQRKQEKEEYAELAAKKKMRQKKEERGMKTNRDKLKSKPFMMTIDKKSRKINSYKQLRVKQSKLRQQMGHVHKGVKGNLKSKKRALKR